MYASRSEVIPRIVGAAVDAVLAARRRGDWLQRAVAGTRIPTLVVDSDRRYIEVNRPGRLLFRLTLAEMRTLTIDDLTPAEELPALAAAWGRLIANGSDAGDYAVAGRDGSQFEITYFAVADVEPGLHLIAFAPATWSDAEFGTLPIQLYEPPSEPLTPRELEILRLAAAGYSGPEIAKSLVISLGTVRKHFDNLYEKLDVSERPAAVAKALRLALIE